MWNTDALTNGTLFTASQWKYDGGRSYKWSTIHYLTITVWRWTLLQIENYSLPHSESTTMDALTNEALFSTSQWLCEDGRSYKWNIIHCLTVTVWRWTLLQMDHYSLLGFDNVKYGRSYKWSTIQCFRVTVLRWMFLQMNYYSLLHSESAEMDALTISPLFIASQCKCLDGRSYNFTTFYCFTV